jgi:hypothetical protein
MVRGFSVINELEKWQGKSKKLNQRKNYRMVNMVNYELKTNISQDFQVWCKFGSAGAERFFHCAAANL